MKITREEYNRMIAKRPHLVMEPLAKVESVALVKVKPKNSLKERFESLWFQIGGPNLTCEVKFCPDRKFRFDYTISGKIAIELEGGVWTNGAHTRGAHFNSDCRKYNLANSMGWHVFRLTTDMINREDIEPILKLYRLYRS